MANEVYTHIYNDTVFIEGNPGVPTKFLVINKPYRYAIKILKAKIIAQNAASNLSTEEIIFSNGSVTSEVSIAFNPGETRKENQVINLSIPLSTDIAYLKIYTRGISTLSGIRIEYSFTITSIGMLSAELGTQSKDYSSMQFEGLAPSGDFDLCNRRYTEYADGIEIIRGEFLVADDVSIDTIYELRNAPMGGGIGFRCIIPAGNRRAVLSGMGLSIDPTDELVFRFISGDPYLSVNPRVNYTYIVPSYDTEIFNSDNPPRFLTHSLEGVAPSVTEQISLGSDVTLKFVSVNTRYNVDTTATIIISSLLTGNSVSIHLVETSMGYAARGFFLSASDIINITVIGDASISYNIGLEFVPYIASDTSICATTPVYCPTSSNSCDCVKFLVLRGEAPWDPNDKKMNITFRQLADGTGYNVGIIQEDVLD